MKIKKIKKDFQNYSKFIFSLRNKKYVRKFSISKNKISINNHKKWFENFIKNKNELFIIFFKTSEIGYIRIEKNKKKNYLSWALLKKYHNKGFAKKSLKKVTNTKKIYYALILKGNDSSEHIAKKSGFRLTKSINNIQYYRKN